jgi:hypothetical protein
MDKKIVTIFGTSRAAQGDDVFALAHEVGLQLAKAGFTIANGGYGGTMLAAAKGAASENGTVLGVTCSAFKSSTPNEFVTRQINTDSLSDRLEKLVEIGDAYVVLQGGTGTLLELAMVWELKNKGFATKDKPIILAGDFWRPLLDLMQIDDPACTNCIKIASDAEEIIELLIDSFRE